jgi:hypothetical protein
MGGGFGEVRQDDAAVEGNQLCEVVVGDKDHRDGPLFFGLGRCWSLVGDVRVGSRVQVEHHPLTNERKL